MNQKEYEHAISKVREIISNDIDFVEKAFEEMKEELANGKRVKMIETLLQLLLLVAHIDQGKKLFIKVLEFSKTIDLEITHKYWNIYDDIENLVKNKFFNITITHAQPLRSI
jgi:hypothetical protein